MCGEPHLTRDAVCPRRPGEYALFSCVNCQVTGHGAAHGSCPARKSAKLNGLNVAPPHALRTHDQRGLTARLPSEQNHVGGPNSRVNFAATDFPGLPSREHNPWLAAAPVPGSVPATATGATPSPTSIVLDPASIKELTASLALALAEIISQALASSNINVSKNLVERAVITSVGLVFDRHISAARTASGLPAMSKASTTATATAASGNSASNINLQWPVQ
jgi:hypothetical protein